MRAPTFDEYASILSLDRLAFTQEVFNQVGSGEYVHNWHVDAILEHLAALESGQIDRLIINMPPRSLKSISVSIAWPAWLLGKNPYSQIIVASHSMKVGTELSAKTRDVMQSPIYQKAFPNTILTKTQEEWFKTTKQGHRLVATVGNKVTGFGADYLIIDDPIDPEAAMSEADRIRANRWIPSTLFSRANDQNTVKIVMVMQRLHENDPTGMLLEKGGWTHLSLPAEFPKDKVISIGSSKWEVEEGELLFPKRLGRDVLDRLRNDMGEYAYAGQYLQHPAPIGGGEFKPHWLKYYNNLSKDFSPQGMNVYIIVDPASGKKTKGYDQDYTAMAVVGLHSDKNYYLLDLVRDRLNPTERINTLIDLHMKWNRKSGKVPKVFYEDYGMQSDVFYLEKTMSQLNYRFPLNTVKGKLKKEDRIRRLIPLFEEERFYLPKQIWYDNVKGERIELIKSLVDDEMGVFPVGKHDDMLDAISRIFDKDVYATFPSSNLRVLKKGETYRDALMGSSSYKEDDFMTW